LRTPHPESLELAEAADAMRDTEGLVDITAGYLRFPLTFTKV